MIPLVCWMAQLLTYRWVVQANMATWSKTELAIAMGTSQDGSRAHELGTHRVWQCDSLRQAQRYLAIDSRDFKEHLVLVLQGCTPDPVAMSMVTVQACCGPSPGLSTC